MTFVTLLLLLYPEGLSPHWHLFRFICLRGRYESCESRGRGGWRAFAFVSGFSFDGCFISAPSAPWAVPSLKGSRERSAGCREGGAAPSCSLIPGGMHVCTWHVDTCSLGLICPLTTSVLSFIYATSADQCLQHTRSWGSCCGFCRD